MFLNSPHPSTIEHYAHPFLNQSKTELTTYSASTTRHTESAIAANIALLAVTGYVGYKAYTAAKGLFAKWMSAWSQSSSEEAATPSL